jgi:protein-arginine kinase activator protein McsA
MVKSFSTRTINKRTIKIAIINEDYENAAILRDKIKKNLKTNKKLSLLVTNIKV